MSKEEIKKILIDFINEYDVVRYNNDKVYEKFSNLIYKQFENLENELSKVEEQLTVAEKVIEDQEAKLAEKEQEINDICQNYDFQINDFSREVYRLQKREKILEQLLEEKN